MTASQASEASEQRLLVEEDGQGERLDKFLATALNELLSRERVQTLIEEGRVRVNEKTEKKASFRLKEGDTVVLSIPEALPISLEAENIPLDVVYEDASLLVINKPTGMLTHPTGRERTGTLVNALLHHCGSSLSGINGFIRPGIVHRLDRETSGLLVVAKTDTAHYHLSAQLKEKSMRREYRAIVQGVPPETTGTVDAPIGRNPKYRDKMAVVDSGRPAVTHWEILDTAHGKYSLIRLQLETGRTHQIRVHMAYIGYPLLGDPLYGSGIEKQLRLRTQGQLLQAFRLSFIHPQGNEPMTFEIPQDPELTKAWDFLGAM